jgi:beta-lactam-binding protein with PASTA domain
MPAIVDISPPFAPESIKAGETGTVAFDLVNVTDRMLHASVAPLPAPGDQGPVPAWLTIEGESTFRLARAETKRVTVALVPPKGDPGAASFRLKVFDVAMPEENNAFSDTVTVAVTPTAEDRPPFPWKIPAAVAAIVLLLAIAGSAAWYILGDREPETQPVTLTMPNVLGFPLDTARTMLTDAGITQPPEVSTPLDMAADGTVQGQAPPAEFVVEPTTATILRVPRLPPAVPDVGGQTIDEARETLANAGIHSDYVVVGGQVFTPAVEPGRVVRQSPAGGAAPSTGQQVTLTLSRSADTAIIPFDPTWNGEQARAAMQERGFTNVAIVEDANALGKEPGRIVRTTPAGGQSVSEDTPIQVFVQSPTANIPNFANRVIPNDELTRLQSIFNVTTVWRNPRDTNRDPNFVFSQSPTGMTPRGADLRMDINPWGFIINPDLVLQLQDFRVLDQPVISPVPTPDIRRLPQ